MSDINLIELDDLSQDLPPETYDLIGRIVTSWSALDHTLLQLLINALSIDAGQAGIVIGRMDSRGKFNRLIAVLKLRKRNSLAKKLHKLRKRIATLQERRNHFAHGVVLGFREKSKELLFLVSGYSFHEDADETIHHVMGYSTAKLRGTLRMIKEMTVSLRAHMPPPSSP